MKKPIYDWEEIFKDSAYILSKSLAEDRRPISKSSELHSALKNYYDFIDKRTPDLKTYNKRMHKKLELEPSQRIMKKSLYKLVGQYYEMSLQALSQNLIVKEEVSSQQICYLFLRLGKGTRTIIQNKELLYSTCKQLKQKFAEEILFLSYDDDTIVLMFSNDKARKKVRKFVEKYTMKQEETELYAE